MRHLQNPFKAFAVFVAMIAMIVFLGSCGKPRNDFRYMIKEASGRFSYTHSYNEVNGCITFTDEQGSLTKVCGTYTIVTQK